MVQQFRYLLHVFTHINGVEISSFCVCRERDIASIRLFSARVNSLYRVRDGVITQIVKGDPQWPQSFYPLSAAVEIQNDDYLVGQCIYDNDDDQIVRVGYGERST